MVFKNKLVALRAAWLTKRKKAQIARFFVDEKKFCRLAERAYKKDLSPQGNVLHTLIGGRMRTMKRDTHQRLFVANNALLFDAHRKAVASGKIVPIHYALSKTRYLFTTPTGTVIGFLPGIGLGDLEYHFENGVLRNPPVKESELVFIYSKEKSLEELRTMERELREKFPGVTLKKVKSMRRELEKNIWKLSNFKKNFNYDLHGYNNVIIRGYDKKTKKFRIALVDQIYPGEEWRVETILEKGKQSIRAQQKRNERARNY